METLKEQALLLGPRKSLVAVLTPGSAVAGETSYPTVVILNSGVIHRVGVSRMSVTLARTLAAVGCTALRFDLSGVGDSDPRPDLLAPLEASLADIKDVLDWLESARGIRRVILAGLCWGADQSVMYAGSDPRVVGVVLLDPSLPRTRAHYLHYYRTRATYLQSWLNVVRGRSPLWLALKRRLTGARATEPEARQPQLDDPEVRAYLERVYHRAHEAEVRFLAVLTGSERYYREHLLDAFPSVRFGDRLRLEYFQASDHMFTKRPDYERVIRLIVEWIQTTSFPAGRH